MTDIGDKGPNRLARIERLTRVQRVVAVLSVGAAIVASASAPAATSQAPRIPLKIGLTVVTAIHDERGDYESIKTIRGVTATDVTVSISAQRVPEDLGPFSPDEVRDVRATRIVSRADLASARTYRAVFGNEDPPRFPGTTALGISTQLFEELKVGRPIELRLTYSGNVLAPLTSLIGSLFGSAAPKELGEAEAVPGMLGLAGTMTLPVLVNDALVELPAIHARGRFGDQDAELWFLDDEGNPLTLRLRLGDERLQVIRLSFPADDTSRTDTPAAARLERALTDTGRAVVYGIYFDFASDRIREESGPVLQEIATVMAKHPDWRLSVEGHTDGIGSPDANLDLSRRRAAAVTQALSGRYAVASARFVSTGFGESRPQDTNDTIEGRARNRRVELVRREQ